MENFDYAWLVLHISSFSSEVANAYSAWRISNVISLQPLQKIIRAGAGAGTGGGTTKGAIFRKRILNLDVHLLNGKTIIIKRSKE